MHQDEVFIFVNIAREKTPNFGSRWIILGWIRKVAAGPIWLDL